eukprot:4322625-Prymnesium_polylepis.2
MFALVGTALVGTHCRSNQMGGGSRATLDTHTRPDRFVRPLGRLSQNALVNRGQTQIFAQNALVKLRQTCPVDRAAR